MPIEYVDAPDVKRRVDEIIGRLGLSYIKRDFVFVLGVEAPAQSVH